MYLKPYYKDHLINYLNGTTSILEYIKSTNSSSSSTPKHIEREWFDKKALAEKSNGKKEWKANKIKLLYVLICLVGSDTDAQFDLGKSWGGNKAIFVTQKKGLLKKYLIKQLNTVPTSTASTTASTTTPRKHSKKIQVQLSNGKYLEIRPISY